MSTALVAANPRFAITPDGNFWYMNSAHAYEYWEDYLEVYDELLLMARGIPHDSPPEGWKQATGPGIRAIAVPDFRSAKDILKQYRPMQEIVRKALEQTDSVHLRLPDPLGELTWRTLPSGRPYAVEVVGDPWDVFAPGAFPKAIRPLYRVWYAAQLKRMCAKASTASYVSEYMLQRRYPPKRAVFTTHFSDATLPEEAYATEPRSFDVKGTLKAIFVGTLEQTYKGPQILIKAIALAREKGLDVQVTLVGDGQYRGWLEDMAAELGITDHVTFTGQVANRDEVRKLLSDSHIFVLPSFQEGVPRGMIEAMAQYLPCISTTVGGIPELLPPEDMVPPGDPEALAAKIIQVAGDPERLAKMSARNYPKSREYSKEALHPRKTALYRATLEQAQKWKGARAGVAS
jgi:glycosyltransferase involved in cell wall biosynthesis